jgi:hypothetical protein
LEQAVKTRSTAPDFGRLSQRFSFFTDDDESCLANLIEIPETEGLWLRCLIRVVDARGSINPGKYSWFDFFAEQLQNARSR